MAGGDNMAVFSSWLDGRSQTTLSVPYGHMRIELACLPQQEAILNPEEDWSGVSNPVERRKRQNRLHQRALRKRRAEQGLPDPRYRKRSAKSTGSVSPAGKEEVPSSPLPATTSTDLQSGLKTTSLELEMRRLWRSAIGIAPLDRSELGHTAKICKLGASKSSHMITHFEYWAKSADISGCPTSDLLLTMIKFNVFRALLSNGEILGYRLEDGMEDEAISQFTDSQAISGPSHLPAALEPTALQKTVPHHPWIDMIPIPKMRDNMILAGDTYDDMELCGDMVGFFSAASGRTGLVVWGEPFDTSGWEVTEDFLKHWGWVIRGCLELSKSTNRWRAERGEKPLRFEEVV